MKSFKCPTLKELPQFLKSVEAKWKYKVGTRFEREVLAAKRDPKLDKNHSRYILSMFPYPSGNLHLGHVRCYTSADVLARYSKLMGKQVINPMGFDSFGLPAENAAIERGLDPANWTKTNIRSMKSQLDDLGLKFNWRQATSNPDFYKWTQFMFLKLFHSNLVYRSYAKVNWDPVDQTVLADEQVDDEGRSWRSGAKVEKKSCKQWFVKVNAFTDSLFEAKDIEPALWGDILTIQRNWIGKPNGWIFYLPIRKSEQDEILVVFVKKPELFLQSDSKLLIARDHWLETVYKISETGFIENPFTKAKLQVQLEDSQDLLPANCQATLRSSIDEVQIDEENHAETSIDHVKREQVLLQAKLSGFGGYFTSETYRDWLVSRQRSWGTPIPMYKDLHGSFQPVSYADLPIKLPQMDFSQLKSDKETPPMVENPDVCEIPTSLGKFCPDDWKQVRDSKGDIIGQRSCETLDTLFDSSWYFLRYANDPSNEEPFNKENTQQVWCYVGGKEHAYMHLFYARFMSHFLHSIDMLNFREPFRKLLVQGHVKSKTYSLNGQYLTEEQRQSVEDESKLIINYEKMSKSKGNGVDPSSILEEYGMDATRFCLMSYANPRSERLWRSSQEEFKDVLIFLRRVILTLEEYISANLKDTSNLDESGQKTMRDASEALIKSINASSFHSIIYLQETNEFRQYISCLHGHLNVLRGFVNSPAVSSREFFDCLASLLVIMNPLAPHLTEELWSVLRQSKPDMKSDRFSIEAFLMDQKWPKPDDSFLDQVKPHKRALYERANL